MVWIIIGQKSTNTRRHSERALSTGASYRFKSKIQLSGYKSQYDLKEKKNPSPEDSAHKKLLGNRKEKKEDNKKKKRKKKEKTRGLTRVLRTGFTSVFLDFKHLSSPPEPSMPPPPATRAGTNATCSHSRTNK